PTRSQHHHEQAAKTWHPIPVRQLEITQANSGQTHAKPTAKTRERTVYAARRGRMNAAHVPVDEEEDD
ncbi:hypothetical protein, partial [Bifidobacterium coryneforme]|uniref:hypothetical protein n=1 Tax=Bifidobacterium coryneforme TaxID=1687 RepID=UPI001E2E7100